MGPVRNDLSLATEREARDRVEVAERVERAEREQAVFGLADEEAVDNRRALHRLQRRGGRERPEPEHRRAVARLQLRHLGGVGLERRRRARKHNQRGMKLVGVELGDEIFDRSGGRGQVVEADAPAALTEQCGTQRQCMGVSWSRAPLPVPGTALAA